MTFKEAFELMKKGEKVKLPSWGGYWYWSNAKQTIMMHTKDHEVLDIRETQRVEYTLSNILENEWVVADETNCPILGGEALFDFEEALKYLKRGYRVKIKDWKEDKFLDFKSNKCKNVTISCVDMVGKIWMFAE